MGVRRISRADRIFYKLLREERRREQGGRCRYCRSPISREEATLDHVVPLRALQVHSDANTAAACERCNREKGHRSAEEFEAELRTPRDGFEAALQRAIAAIEARTRLAEWRLATEPRGSYAKWTRYRERHEDVAPVATVAAAGMLAARRALDDGARARARAARRTSKAAE